MLACMPHALSLCAHVPLLVALLSIITLQVCAFIEATTERSRQLYSRFGFQDWGRHQPAQDGPVTCKFLRTLPSLAP